MRNDECPLCGELDDVHKRGCDMAPDLDAIADEISGLEVENARLRKVLARIQTAGSRQLARQWAREALAPSAPSSLPIVEDSACPPDQVRMMQDGKLVGAIVNFDAKTSGEGK